MLYLVVTESNNCIFCDEHDLLRLDESYKIIGMHDVKTKLGYTLLDVDFYESMNTYEQMGFFTQDIPDTLIPVYEETALLISQLYSKRYSVNVNRRIKKIV